MGKYKIYRGFLPNGKEKIGATNEYPRRCEKQNMRDYYIMEEHDCEFITSDREIELQLKYLGERDSKSPYHVSLRNRAKGGCKDTAKLSEMGTKGAYAMWEKYPDMGKKIAESHKNNGKLKGSGNPAAKLTADKVRYIRKMCKRGGGGKYSYQRMADELGVSKGHIANVMSGLLWSHV
jgi:hypothetical protein